ncbi:hypothetical protein [Microcoleus sp. FACHB-831]|uniref:hypothetical protein n=1 Tax=Microcoleus sp. FACHB-831 TaxID=2692827 RepID=UPI0016885F13|nr:hypothetical protein [Microcoleus sp. FACHB-831]
MFRTKVFPNHYYNYQDLRIFITRDRQPDKVRDRQYWGFGRLVASIFAECRARGACRSRS